MVYELLNTGEENAITGRTLRQILRMSERDLTATIERERRQGKPICASTGANPGYYLAADKEEMETYCRRLHHRAEEIHETRRACLATICDLPQ